MRLGGGDQKRPSPSKATQPLPAAQKTNQPTSRTNDPEKRPEPTNQAKTIVSSARTEKSPDNAKFGQTKTCNEKPEANDSLDDGGKLSQLCDLENAAALTQPKEPASQIQPKWMGDNKAAPISPLEDLDDLDQIIDANSKRTSSDANQLPIAEPVVEQPKPVPTKPETTPQLVSPAESPAKLLAQEALPQPPANEEVSSAITVESGIILDQIDSQQLIELPESGLLELDDNDESEVIELSDADVVVDAVGVPLAAASSVPKPAFKDPSTTAVGQNPNATPTSTNPIYRPFGPPPQTSYPNEIPVPDSDRIPMMHGPNSGPNQPMDTGMHGRNDGVPLMVILALLASLSAIIFGGRVVFTSYQVVNLFLPGAAFPYSSLPGATSVIWGCIYGLRLVAGLGLVVCGALFFTNEINRLVSRTNPMPNSCIMAIIAGAAYLLLEFGNSIYSMFNLSRAFLIGVSTGSSFFQILLYTFLHSLIPIALILTAAFRRR